MCQIVCGSCRNMTDIIQIIQIGNRSTSICFERSATVDHKAAIDDLSDPRCTHFFRNYLLKTNCIPAFLGTFFFLEYVCDDACGNKKKSKISRSVGSDPELSSLRTNGAAASRNIATFFFGFRSGCRRRYLKKTRRNKTKTFPSRRLLRPLVLFLG